jgi:Cu(I)/Ag(I) efflux system membrane protein CusA/SilA
VSALRDAVVEGALLRLRPKVMTVSTVVAGLLPIMWSTRPGAEVMKPLATPVLGGMVSSLLHVLVVTPVIFFLLRQRRLGLAREIEPVALAQERAPRRSARVVVGVLSAVALLGLLAWQMASRRSSPTAGPSGRAVVQTIRSGTTEIVIRSPGGVLRRGHNAFAIEFRSANGALLDVGTVHATANMAMPGMVMPSGMAIRPTEQPGRYEATADFGMAGSWPITIEWNGPGGQGSVSFQGAVQ